MLLLVEGEAEGDRLGLINAARSLGHRVHPIPSEGTLEPGAPRVPGLVKGDFQWGLLLGDIPSPERYRAIHDEARAANVTLLNDPEQHLNAVELHRTLPQLGELTARTAVVRSAAEVDAALQRVAPPVFVKTTVLSRKWHGWKACVAETAEEARVLCSKALALESSNRGVVLVRELLPLRKTGSTENGFPVAREYRLFVLDADVVGIGFYWPGGDPFGVPSERDDREMRALAHEVAKRTRVPWLVVDVGQLESGEWKVIETGDPSCAGLSSVEPRGLIGAVAEGLVLRAGC